MPMSGILDLTITILEAIHLQQHTELAHKQRSWTNFNFLISAHVQTMMATLQTNVIFHCVQNKTSLSPKYMSETPKFWLCLFIGYNLNNLDPEWAGLY